MAWRCLQLNTPLRLACLQAVWVSNYYPAVMAIVGSEVCEVGVDMVELRRKLVVDFPRVVFFLLLVDSLSPRRC